MQQLLEKLAKRRPVFHSEADFQHELAWQIHLEDKEARIRLEKPIKFDKSTAYLDLLVKSKNCHVAIELKYKTCKLRPFNNGDEEFNLKDQSALDTGRYDFIKDIMRLECYVKANSKSEGFAIFLTNDKSYWTEQKNANSNDFAFRIFDGKSIHGDMAWGEGASKGTTLGRAQNIVLNGQYEVVWQHYSKLGESDRESLKFLLLHIKHDKAV